VSDGARRYPLGPELLTPELASFRIWAPAHTSVSIEVGGVTTPMQSEAAGYFSATLAASVGCRYGFRLGSDERLYPDPASRWQPEGPEAPSALADLSAFEWRDRAWPGVALPGQVLYEMHVGTFTRDGTWRAAEARLPRLRELGVTVVQMMPVAEFAGGFGWGYDGVQWFAPMHAYGIPADLQHFVDTAHQLGLAVILDVVYNHFGPAGNFLPAFSPYCFADRKASEWGPTLNFDGERSEGMRELVLSNVAYWVREFHIDGFRLDATQQIVDDSPEHIVAAIARVAREAAVLKSVIVVAEHEPQHARLLRPASDGGYGLDGLFNEDFHHSMRVALTGNRDAYLTNYRGSSREWLALAQSGFLFQGQYYPWQSSTRGAPALDRPSHQFIAFLENHDQVANQAAGRRLIEMSSPSWWRAMTALLLLGPWTPMLFQGQEWAARVPFRYFADHGPELQPRVQAGRRKFTDQFSRTASFTDGRQMVDDHIGRSVFEACRLRDEAPVEDEPAWRMCRDLLALRRDDPGLGQRAGRLLGAALGDQTLALRFVGTQAADERLLIVNLAPDLNIAAIPEPLCAPPEACAWSVLWCSEDPRYGGGGLGACTPPRVVEATGHAATVFHPLPADS
jgi:maltooligosyltrehalose trehalohydrolase